MSTTLPVPQVAPNKTKLLTTAARIHRQILKDNEELREENRRLAKEGWARSNYCKHGTFIGDPYGPDYLCGYCEDGSTDLEVALGQAYDRFRRDRNEYEQAILWLSLYGQNLADYREKGLRLFAGSVSMILHEMGQYIEIATKFEEAWL